MWQQLQQQQQQQQQLSEMEWSCRGLWQVTDVGLTRMATATAYALHDAVIAAMCADTRSGMRGPLKYGNRRASQTLEVTDESEELSHTS